MRRLIVLALLGMSTAVLILTVTAGASAQGHRVYLPEMMQPPGVTPTVTPVADSCTRAPLLLQPADGASLDTLVPVFMFDATGQAVTAEYHLEVSSTASFDRPVLSMRGRLWMSVRSTRFPENLVPGTRYYWRVQLLCGAQASPWSPVWSFNTPAQVALLPAPQKVYPADGSLAVAQPVTLRWEPVPGASEYLAKWRERGDVGFAASWTTQTDSGMGDMLQPGSAYEWTVAAYDGHALGADAPWWSFSTAP